MYSFGFSTNRSATPSSLKATTPYLLGSRAGAPRSLMSPLPLRGVWWAVVVFVSF
jgi:hypothetical protein